MARRVPHYALDLVIRPSGVWDTRAPFFVFLKRHSQENEFHHGMVLTLERVVHEARLVPPESSARALFKAKKTSHVAGLAWISYKRSLQSEQQPSYHPTVRDASRTLRRALPLVSEHAIVRHCGLFETFCQCSALNLLLARLEAGRRWTVAERALARNHWPIGTNRQLPTLNHILSAFPNIEAALRRLPHVFTDRRTGDVVDIPVSANLNALTAIRFWRDWRNLLVHSAGLVSMHFSERNRAFFQEASGVFPLGGMIVGKKLRVGHESFRALATTHYRAALRLRELVIAESNERRGHSRAPQPVPPEGFETPRPIAPPPMLIEGDHHESWRWVADIDYREELRRSIET